MISHSVRRVLRVDVSSRFRAAWFGALISLAFGALLSLVALLASPSSRADPPVTAPTCALRLSLEVTPDVPDPTDPGFISSLLSNHPGYQLYLLGKIDDTHVMLQLQGPGPGERCQEVVDSMRNDGRVSSIDVS